MSAAASAKHDDFVMSTCHAERVVRLRAQHPPGPPLPPLASLRPPASALSACLVRDGIVPTLATGRSNHPQFLHPPGY